MKTLPPPGSTVAFYGRYSTKNQDYKSIEGQFEVCQDFATANQWEVVGKFSDAGRSGTTTVGRQGFFDMLASGDRGEFQVLLVEDIDRLARDAADMHGLKKNLDEMDIALCSVSTGGIVSGIEVAFKSVQNEEYVRQSKEKTKRGQRHAVNEGRICGSLTYGQRKVLKEDARGKAINGHREIHPEHAAIVQRIFTEYDAGVSTLSICAALNREGIPAPRGGRWTPGVLTGSSDAAFGVLRNQLHIGEFHWPRTSRKRKQGKIQVRPTPKSEQVVTYHPHLALIEREMFDRVQERLERGGQGPFQSKRRAEYLFSGKLVCGSCGCQYVVMSGRLGCVGRIQMGICDNGRRAPREAVEAAVLERLRLDLLIPDLLEPCLQAYRDEASRALAEHEARVEQGAGRLKEVEKQIANLIGQLSGMSETSYAQQLMMKQLETLGAEQKRLERERKLKPRALGPALDADSVVARLKATIDELRQALSGDDREAVRSRELIRALIDRIVVSPIPGTHVDGRGAGPVWITVEGRLGQLLGLADIPINRDIQHDSRTETSLDDSILTYRITFRLAYDDPRLVQAYSDVAVISKFLDLAHTPVTTREMSAALLDAPIVTVAAELIDEDDQKQKKETTGKKRVRDETRIDLRMRNVQNYFVQRGLARLVKAPPARSGWVWNYIGLSDEEWRERAFAPKLEPIPMHLRQKPRDPNTIVTIGRAGNGLDGATRAWASIGG